MTDLSYENQAAAGLPVAEATENSQPAGDVTESSGAAETPGETRPTSRFALWVSLELILYVALFAFTFALRLPELGTVPLGDGEAHEALAAFRTVTPGAPGNPLVSHAPLMFSVNTLTMAIAGSDNAATRMPTVIVGSLMVLLPLGLRRWFGPSRALILAGLLAISPVLLTASRTMSGSVWSAALALGAVVLAAKFYETRRAPYGICATAAVLLLVVMSETAGFLTFLSLVVGVALAIFAGGSDERPYREAVGETLGNWPWTRGLVAGAVVIGLTGTVFLLFPRGLSAIGETLDQGLQGFIFRPANYPIAFPLITSLLYEPLLWIFGAVGIYFVFTRSDEEPDFPSFLGFGLVGWLIASITWSLVYPSAEPSHALWLTIPLAGLSAIALDKVLAPVRDRFWQVPGWGPWLHGIAVAGMFAITWINMVIVGQQILAAQPALVPQLDKPMHVAMMVLSLVLIAVTFFLVGSIWGARAAAHGMGIGVLLFFAAYGLSAGWHASVGLADDPRELWRVRPAAENLALMESTLVQASRRATGMSTDIPILLAGLPDDGALAWALHHFTNVQYTAETDPTDRPAVIIAPRTKDPPKFASNYVGQDFPVYYSWDRSTMTNWDWVAWLSERTSRVAPVGDARIVLWVRGDIYGLPSSNLSPVNNPPQ